MPILRVVAHLRAKPDKVEETKLALTALVEPTRAETGCILYELSQNNANPADFTFVEEWESDEALDVHLESGHIQELRSRVDELFVEPPDIRRYTVIA